MIRWIVTDLDGTLVGRDLVMVPASRRALRRFLAAGGEVFIATGRMEASARPFYDELGLSGEAILYNGARTVDLGTGSVLRSRHLPPAAWKSLLGLFDELPRGVYPVVFSGEEALATHDVPELRRFAQRDGIRLRHPGDWSTLPPGEITKCMLIGAPLPSLDIPETTLVRSEATYLEVLPPGATKGAALRELAVSRGVPLTQVAAIGDNPNDLDMIETAGLGVAVGDGHPDVRAASDVVVGACADGAVADLVELALS
ncbi:HAD family hydrolase [Nonomuraea cavernae]|uniref:Haloacid dehalogenase n=1 Tax=Nonomuraea cavernae TaxID=2045107 RepID=A0A918DFV4_9ACTN|nr:HAD-IIB family hydrolase [Nonomuraea cavernae]MCA2184157.1 HAD-IIB family hydrolase [Nonomuraea cavernae]GGO62479.1 haloacid dehalogenase [Nonomuraea cavernae]